MDTEPAVMLMIDRLDKLTADMKLHFENLEHRHRVLFEQVQDLKQLHDRLTTEHRKLWGELTAARQLWNDHMDQFHGEQRVPRNPALEKSIGENLEPDHFVWKMTEIANTGEDPGEDLEEL